MNYPESTIWLACCVAGFVFYVAGFLTGVHVCNKERRENDARLRRLAEKASAFNPKDAQ